MILEKEKKRKERKKKKRRRRREKNKKREERERRERTERKECEESGGFRCLICFEVMKWEREPRSLPCGHSFCSGCLNKLFFSQQTSTSTSESGDGGDGLDLFLSPLQVRGSSSSSSPSSSSSSSCLNDVGKRCCPVCRKEIEGGCETIESFDPNSFIPETIDVIKSSKIPSLCIPPTPCFSFSLFLCFQMKQFTSHHKQFPTNKTKECANFGN